MSMPTVRRGCRRERRDTFEHGEAPVRASRLAATGCSRPVELVDGPGETMSTELHDQCDRCDLTSLNRPLGGRVENEADLLETERVGACRSPQTGPCGPARVQIELVDTSRVWRRRGWAVGGLPTCWRTVPASRLIEPRSRPAGSAESLTARNAMTEERRSNMTPA